MSALTKIALGLIRAYKLTLSPYFAGSCRYTPGCADYMTESITRHGLLRGGWLGTKRLCRCHPFGGHGYDPVPSSLDRSPDHHIDRQTDRHIDLHIATSLDHQANP